MKIQVRAFHIKSGVREDPFYCPIARAIHAKRPKANVYVDRDGLELNGRLIKLPLRVVRFIEAFDDGKEVKPMSFNLSL